MICVSAAATMADCVCVFFCVFFLCGPNQLDKLQKLPAVCKISPLFLKLSCAPHTVKMVHRFMFPIGWNDAIKYLWNHLLYLSLVSVACWSLFPSQYLQVSCFVRNSTIFSSRSWRTEEFKKYSHLRSWKQISLSPKKLVIILIVDNVIEESTDSFSSSLCVVLCVSKLAIVAC